MKYNIDIPCLIPARGGSKGIPRKNLTCLGGKPLIAWAIEAAKAAQTVSQVYVSTEDEEIAEVAHRYGASIIYRPTELAEDDITSEAVLLHALDCINLKLGADPEVVIFVQCTSPLLLPEDIESSVNLLFKEHADSIISVAKGSYYLWRRCLNGAAEAVNHDPHMRLPRQLDEYHFRETGAVYAFRSEQFRREKTRYCGKVILYEMPTSRSFEIDEPEDLQMVESIMHTRLLKEKLSSK